MPNFTHNPAPSAPSPAPERAPGPRMDMHAHSRASDQPVVPSLRFLGCPECFSPPEQVYDQARARGMDFVTLTDHDTIAGALELHERGFQNFIIGEEVSVCFPEDRCKIHVLVWGHTAAQHEQIASLGLRDDAYQCAAWLRENDLAHSLAHPLYVQNHRFTERHLERCCLLFRAFETLNGAHATARHRDVVERYIGALSPERVAMLAERHEMAPIWPAPWKKGVTAGSDDHALLNAGRTWTRVGAGAASAREFVRRVMAGEGEVGGQAGGAAPVAHQIAAVALNFYAAQVHDLAPARTRAVFSRLARFAGVPVKKPTRREMLWDAFKGKTVRRGRRTLPITQALRDRLPEMLGAFPELRARLDAARWLTGSAMSEHPRMEEFVDSLVRAIAGELAPEAARAFREKDKPAAVESALSYAALAISQAPYLFALFHEHKDGALAQRLEQELESLAPSPASPGPLDRPMRLAVFTDTLGDVNGVSRFVQNLAEQARRTGCELRIITSTHMRCPESGDISNFAPLLTGKLPHYQNLDVVAPPLIEMLRDMDRWQPDVVHVSTPGPVGIAGLVAGRMLRAPIVGVHHTDFPAYLDRMVGDPVLVRLTEEALGWFYHPFHTVFTRSEAYVDAVEALGVPREKIRALRPGLDTRVFDSRFADPALWRRFAGVSPTSVKVVYVGRLSVEKNMPLLVGVWRRALSRCAARGVEAELILVGDGPYRAQMEADLAGQRAHFLGFRSGEELSALYASSDLFVFPSTTDTLGQVVLEAEASGLPVIVTDQGGPREVVEHGATGLVLPATDEDAWAEAIADLAADPERRRRMGRAASELASGFSLELAFKEFWSAHEAVWRAHLRAIGVRRHDGESSEPRDRPAPGSIRPSPARL